MKFETEMRNPKSENLDEMTIKEIISLMNEEDATIPVAIAREIDNIEKVIKTAIETIRKNGKVFYVGAGTSGRLAVIDSVELYPTFSVQEDHFVPIIAGGKDAFFKAIEGAEDDTEQAKKDLKEKNINTKDFVIGITASGRTPYVGSALEFAKSIGCKTALITNVSQPKYEYVADIVVRIITGPEILTGSTRLKAGTSQKMILNMISTITMIKLGKVYKNYMIDVKVLNSKLQERAKKIVVDITGISEKEAENFLEEANFNTKLAILMILSNKTKNECENALSKYNSLREALNYLKS